MRRLCFFFPKSPQKEVADEQTIINTADFENKSEVSFLSFSLFIRNLQKAVAKKLIYSVIISDIKAAKAIIKADTKLLRKNFKFIDLSGREFENITLFQYAWIMLDSGMCEMMSTYLSKEEIIQQLAVLDEKSKFGPPITWKPLIAKLAEYTNRLKSSEWALGDLNASKFWRESIGSEQKKLPAHVVKAYYLRSPAKLAALIVHERPRTIVISTIQEWFNPKLGTELAVFRGQTNQAIACRSIDCIDPNKGGWVDDQKALTKLLRESKENLLTIKEELRIITHFFPNPVGMG